VLVLLLLLVLADARARYAVVTVGLLGLLSDRQTNLLYQVTIRRLTW
jgi:hypothetical protein